MLVLQTCLTMEPQLSLQDVIQCHLCETPLPSKHCDICHEHLCDVCEEKHISDESKEHYIVPIKMQNLTLKCCKHSTNLCKQHCEHCNDPICAECISSGKHEQHEIETFLKLYSRKERLIQRDLQELEKIIYPSYQEVALKIPVQRDVLSTHSKKLKATLKNKADTFHREIDTIIQKTQSDIDDMDSVLLAEINKQEIEIKKSMEEISQVILNGKMLLNTSDAYQISKYKSRNHTFKRLPNQLQATLPTFTPMENDREQISKLIGSLSKLEVYWRPISTAFHDKPRIVTGINIRHKPHTELQRVSCLNDSRFWTVCGDHNEINLYKLQEQRIWSIRCESVSMLLNIAVTRSGDLVFINNSGKSINVVHGTEKQTLIRLRGWRALNLCSTSSADLLVIMYTYNKELDNYETKITRFSGSHAKQSIRWDDTGRLLNQYTYLIENRNLDICVCDTRAVVVVNENGQFRFKYIGNPHSTQRSFNPAGICRRQQS